MSSSSPPPKRRKISASASPVRRHDSSTESESDGDLASVGGFNGHSQQSGDIVKVVKLAWFTDSVSRGAVLPVEEYLTYQGRKVPSPTQVPPVPKASDILSRAMDDAEDAPTSTTRHGSSRGYGAIRGQHLRTSTPVKRPGLTQETTSEHDIGPQLPPIPDYLRTIYSCQRPTPSDPPNDAFIEELKKIRTTRLLEGNKTGVRAYSTAIATLAAYPHLLTRAEGKLSHQVMPPRSMRKLC